MPPDSIEQTIRALLEEEGELTSAQLVERTGRTRQALHRHLSRAVRDGWLVREGRGRATRYRAPRTEAFDRAYATSGLREEQVAAELAEWLGQLGLETSQGAERVLAYATTELVNNAMDHSGARQVRVQAEVEGARLRLAVADAGIGAFENLRSLLGLEDHLHALQELTKGKTTTQPERHSGEGLFFTSRMADRFELRANGFSWIVTREPMDQAVLEVEVVPGTEVRLEISLSTPVEPERVFGRYTTDLRFDRTRCVIRLFEYGAEFVSRSEAKRLLANLERFREVTLDFEGVRGVGQGFVDEVFRVWARGHPDTQLVPVSMNSAVDFMVRRGLARAEEIEGR